MQFIQFQSQDPNSLNTPSAGSFNIFIDQTDNTLKVKDQAGDVYGGGGGFSDTTYSGLVNLITTSGLTAGGFYLITNFRTCYDQPDFNYAGSSITTGNYKQSAIEPIMVFATSISTISVDAYQPAYPKDKIQYDWTYSATEVTNGVAYGRISERIDEFNNRTDYDHRTILFKRYRLYTHRQDQPLNGTIELLNDGTVNGTNTSFTALTVGDVIYVPNVDPSFYEITGITDSFEMFVSGDTISTGASLVFYKAIEEDNGEGGYFSYKRTNVKTNDFIEYTTFGNVIVFDNFAKNNYVGNYANNYTNISNGDFILANNVFLEGPYESNKFGDSCYDNTFGTDNQNNTWGNHCHRNVSTNDIDDNIFGHFFYNNLINVNLQSNIIGDNFNNNRLLSENSQDFGDNIIGNNFNNNTIYSRFYRNEILHGFNSNTIGDFGNLTNFEFYRNYIRNNFNENIIRRDFQNNQIGTNFQQNTTNGEFIGNTILNGYNNNTIGDYFGLNNIGNGFNGNTIYDNFYSNTTDYYFYSNVISSNFYNNDVRTYFYNNEPTNLNLFSWNNTSIENLTGRTYNTFYNSLESNIDGFILGKELIMHDTNNDEYHKVKFTQWTQDGNGGGFSYERTKVYPTVESTVVFTKTNYGNEVDIIVEGSLEITRDDNGAIYNTADEGGWDSNQSPIGTEWNSIYTETSNNGSNFQDNVIFGDFKGNYIRRSFGANKIDITVGGNQFSGETYLNNIGPATYDNDFLGDVYGNNLVGNFYLNVIGDSFESNSFGNSIYSNTIGQDFYSNNIKEYFYENTIGNGFQTNQIGSYFNTNTIADYFGYGYGAPQGNKIGSNFYNNTVGEYFYNNTIPDNFTENTIGNYFQWNIVNTSIDSTDFTPNYGNITGFTYTATGTSATDAIYTSLAGVTTSEFGVNATFDIEVSSGAVIGVSGNTEGKLYLTGDTITILGTEIGGYSNAIDTISDDGVGKNGSDGTYNDLSVTGGTGTNATFDVSVNSSLVDSVIINNRGNGYEINDELTIIGSLFGGTDGVDDITITVTALFDDDIVITVSGVTIPSVYEHYTCQLFERQGGVKRLSFYDENDILTITNINE